MQTSIKQPKPECKYNPISRLVDKNCARRITAVEQTTVYESARKTALVTLQPGAYIVEINDGILKREANYSVEVTTVK